MRDDDRRDEVDDEGNRDEADARADEDAERQVPDGILENEVQLVRCNITRCVLVRKSERNIALRFKMKRAGGGHFWHGRFKRRWQVTYLIRV